MSCIPAGRMVALGTRAVALGTCALALGSTTTG
jgi:hypothetical protein